MDRDREASRTVRGFSSTEVRPHFEGTVGRKRPAQNGAISRENMITTLTHGLESRLI